MLSEKIYGFSLTCARLATSCSAKKRSLAAPLLVLAAMCWFSRGAFAAPAGALDSGFSVGSSDSGVNAILLQPDGKVVIAGTFTYYHSLFRPGIARLNDDASADASFDAGSVAASGNGVEAAYLYPDGRVLIAGGFYSGGRSRIARLNSNGSLDASFDPGAGPNGDIECLAVQPDGKVIIGGIFTSVAGQTHARLARLNGDGSLDTNFVASADNDVHALAVQPDGRIVVAGWFSHLNGTSPSFLARLNPDGTSDTSFTSSVNVPVECVALQPDGKIVVGGDFSFSIGSSLARIAPDGSWDAGFATAVGPWIHTIQLQGDGRIMIGRNFATVNGVSQPYVARLYSDGSPDSSFSAAPDNLVNLVAIQPDGKFIIAGGFGTVQGTEEDGPARLFGDEPTATPTLQFNGAAFQAYQSDPGITIPVFRSGNSNVTVSVQFATADLEAQAGSDYVSTSGTLNFAPGELVKSIAVPLLNDGNVTGVERFVVVLTNAVGGVLGANSNATISIGGVNGAAQFITPDIVTNELANALKITLVRLLTNIPCSVVCQTVGGTAVAGVNYSNMTQTVTFAPGQATNSISVFLLDDDQPGPDVCFTVQLSNPQYTTTGARTNVTITVLDNDAPGHPGFGLNGAVYALSATADGEVVLGGGFTSVNGTPRNRVGKVHADGSVDDGFAPGTGADGTLSAILVQPDGTAMCGGSFASYNGASRPKVMRLNGNGTLDSSFDPGAGANGTVQTLAPAPDGGCFAGGTFTSYAGVARPGVARINRNGSLNTNFVPQMPSGSYYVVCLATQTSGGLLVGTYIPFLGSTNFCFRLKPDGSRDSTFTNRISGVLGAAQVNTLVPQPDGKILAGGYFSSIGIARFNTNGSVDATFSPSGGVGSGTIMKLLWLDTGQLLAVGRFSSYAGVMRNNIVRINADGSIDKTFDPGLGPDSTVLDVAALPGNHWAIGGLFLHVAKLPRYYFAILGPTGQLITRIKCESFTAGSDLQFGLMVEPETPFQLLASPDLKNWQVVYSNILHNSFTNLTWPNLGADKEFFRVLQSP